MISETLDIDAKSVEDLFDMYNSEQLIVNRRYQRKLVWSINEKKALISSMAQEYPIPLLLFVKLDDGREILDGMQRLEAIMSFIEQKFDHNGKYFDLDATAITKLLKDTGKLTQKAPTMSRTDSVQLARYKFAVSEYTSSATDIDEVFRRINSNGKTLSKQELRSAGSISIFSELVRKLAIQVRGDTSHSDTLKLNSMANISINNEGLGYGVSIDHHFYVKHGVLTRTSIRESADEELVANILGYICLEEKPTSGSEQLDGFYGLRDSSKRHLQRQQLDNYIQTRGVENIIADFMYVYSQLTELFENSGISFKTHVLGMNTKSTESPSYFQAVFLSFYEVLIKENMQITDPEGLIAQLKDIGQNTIKVSDGGKWSAIKRQESVDDLTALILRYFEQTEERKRNQVWVTEIDNILTSSKTEQTYYDFKQGFRILDGNDKFSDDVLAKVLSTAVGINNIGKSSEGYIIIGIADQLGDAERIRSLYGVDYIEKNGFYICGVDDEANRLFGSLDTYFSAIKDKITNNYTLTEGLKQQILKKVRLCDYKGKHLIKIDINSIGKVSKLDDKYFLRQGTSTTHLTDTDAIENLITNYLLGK